MTSLIYLFIKHFCVLEPCAKTLTKLSRYFLMTFCDALFYMNSLIFRLGISSKLCYDGEQVEKNKGFSGNFSEHCTGELSMMRSECLLGLVEEFQRTSTRELLRRLEVTHPHNLRNISWCSPKNLLKLPRSSNIICKKLFLSKFQ
jgi:hypothetical protein